MSISFKLGDDGAEGKLKVNGFGSCKLVPYGVLADFDSKFDDRWTTTKENEDWENFIDWNTKANQIKDEVYETIPTQYFNKTELASFSYLSEGDLINSNSSVNQWAGAFATNEKAAAAYTLAVDANYTDLDGNTISAVSGIQLGAIAGQDNKSSYMDFMANNIRFFATSARIVDEETGELTPATIEVDDVDKVAKSPTDENGEPMPAFGMLAEPDGQGGYQYKTYFNGNVIFLDGPNSGSTLIKGGYINTDLIETDKLIVGASNTARHFGSWGTGDDVQDGDNVMQDSGGQLTVSEVAQRNPIYEGITFRDGDTYFNIGEATNYVYDADSANDGVNAGWRSTRGADSSGYSMNLSEDLYVAHRDGSGNWDTSDASTTVEVYSGTANVTSEFDVSIPVTAGFSLVGGVLTYTGTLTGDKPSKYVVITATNILDSSITLSKQYRIITLEDGNAYRLNVHQPVVKLAPNGEVSTNGTTITWDVAHHVGNSVVDATADKTVYYKGPGDSGYMSAGTDGTVSIGDLVDSIHNKGEVEFIITEDDTASGMVYDKETLPIVWDAGSPYTGELTNDNHTCPSDALGGSINYTGASTECELYLGGGTTPLSNVSVKVNGVSSGSTTINGATVTVSGTTVTLTGLSVDSATIPIDFFYDGVPVNVTKSFSVSKSKQGTTGVGYKLSLRPSVLKQYSSGDYTNTMEFQINRLNPDGSIDDLGSSESGFTIEYRYFTTTWIGWDTIVSGANISVPSDAVEYNFRLKQNGTVVDLEGARVIRDGKDGGDGGPGVRGTVSGKCSIGINYDATTDGDISGSTIWAYSGPLASANAGSVSGTVFTGGSDQIVSTSPTSTDINGDILYNNILNKFVNDIAGEYTAIKGDEFYVDVYQKTDASYPIKSDFRKTIHAVYTGSVWLLDVKSWIHGDAIIDGTLKADKLVANSLLLTSSTSGGAGYVGSNTPSNWDSDGVFLGYHPDGDSSAWKFHVGSSTNYVKWDGTNLNIKGNLTADSVSSGSIPKTYNVEFSSNGINAGGNTFTDGSNTTESGSVYYDEDQFSPEDGHTVATVMVLVHSYGYATGDEKLTLSASLTDTTNNSDLFIGSSVSTGMGVVGDKIFIKNVNITNGANYRPKVAFDYDDLDSIEDQWFEVDVIITSYRQ
jgi:hypothetical protein